jgi:hypothetical protein
MTLTMHIVLHCHFLVLHKSRMVCKCQAFFFGRSSVRLITRMDAPGDPLTIVWFAFENQVCCFRWYTMNTSISSKQNWIHLASKIELMFYHNQVCCFRWYTVYFITLYFVGYYLQCVKDSRPCKTLKFNGGGAPHLIFLLAWPINDPKFDFV